MSDNIDHDKLTIALIMAAEATPDPASPERKRAIDKVMELAREGVFDHDDEVEGDDEEYAEDDYAEDDYAEDE